MAYPGPITSAYMLEDGGSAITAARAGRVGGNDRVYDFGADVTFNGFMIVHVTAITTGSGRSYAVKGELCASSGFSSGVVTVQPFTLAAMPAGDGEVPIIISNKVIDTKYRYGRFWLEPIGAGASITLSAWLLPSAALETLSTPNLAAMMGVVTERFNQATTLFRNWSGGTASGGPNGDGNFPLADAAGNVQLIPCPAKLIENIGGAGLSMASINDLPEATESDVAIDKPEPVVIGIVGPSGSRTLKKFSTYLINARKTKDMQPFVDLLSEELIPAFNQSTGLEYSIAIGEIMRQTMGMVNPLRYGVKNDARTSRRAFSMEAGDNVVECTEQIFRGPSVVGQAFMIGGAGAGYGAAKGTVTAYIDSRHVRVSFNSANDISGQDAVVGTLNTTAMQNALLDCFNPAGVYNYGAICMLPGGDGVLTGALLYMPRTGIIGHGARQSSLIRYDDTFETNAFPRWDGDTNYYGCTQYYDGSYYIPVYPNAYVAPNYAGSYRPDVAPTLCNRIGTDRYGVTWSFDDSPGQYAQRGTKVDSDFNVFSDFTMNGSRYCSNRLLPGWEFRGGLFAYNPSSGMMEAPYNQVDPYLRVRDLNLHLHGHVPMATFGQCSGIITGIHSEDNNLCGYLHRAFDCNISNCYFMANNGPGIIADGTNTNWTTMKVSFNVGVGNGWFIGDEFRAMANLLIPGIGHNWNNLRVQESYGPNIMVLGRGNDFTGAHADDTGCVYPVHNANNDAGVIAANMNWITPAIFVGPLARDLRLNDVGIGGLVHVGDNYASHAIFYGSGVGGVLGEYSSGRVYTKSIGSWYNSGNSAITGDYAPNEWGAEGGALPTGTNITVNGVDIATL